MLYAKYSPYLGKAYDLGFSDCYSLVRDFYISVYSIFLPNYARPEGYAYNNELSVFARILSNPDFVSKPVAREYLEVGDVLVFRVASDQANHLGIYVGNNLFIHHLHGGLSKEDNLDHKHFRRIMTVIRHKDAENAKVKSNFSQFLSPMFQQKSGEGFNG